MRHARVVDRLDDTTNPLFPADVCRVNSQPEKGILGCKPTLVRVKSIRGALSPALISAR